jgi:hypothetical protein
MISTGTVRTVPTGRLSSVTRDCSAAFSAAERHRSVTAIAATMTDAAIAQFRQLDDPFSVNSGETGRSVALASGCCRSSSTTLQSERGIERILQLRRFQQLGFECQRLGLVEFT